jgi:hypothetical protein
MKLLLGGAKMHVDDLVSIRLTYGDWLMLSEILERYSGRPTNVEYCPEEEQPIIKRFNQSVEDLDP